MELNIGLLVEHVARAVPGREAVVHGARRFTYRDFVHRCRRLGHVLSAHGLGPDDFVLLDLTNCPEYLEGMVGGYLARVAPANVNYRYTPPELAYLVEDSGARAVILHARFAPVLAVAGVRLPDLVLQVDDGSGTPLLPGALDYEAALAAAPATPVKPVHGPATPDDLYVVYTGGTTGRPKGVLWRQTDFLASALGIRGSYDELARQAAAARSDRLRTLPAPPLMHGAAHWNALSCLASGGTVVMQEQTEHLDADDVLDTVERERCTSLLIVGDAFARPLIDAQRRRRRDLASLRHLVSGGAVLSPSTKSSWWELVPTSRIVDIMGSSESGRQGIATGLDAGTFERAATTVVLSADRSRLLEAGDDELGWLAQSGPMPLGYHRDPAKTAATFPTVGGVRYVVAGDRARLRADGSIEVLGREAATINPGGEKVFAEEVEQAVRTHPAVLDAIVVGRQSERWGQEVVAVVALRDGSSASDDELRAACATTLARYKLPKAFVRVEAVTRTPSGKPEYGWARRAAASGP
ncbi:MAG: AMP-binding protein [Acidimicrobiales bacterium]